MGIKMSDTAEPDRYRGMVDRCVALVMKRNVNPQLYNDTIFSWTSIYRELSQGIRALHAFSGSVIGNRRVEFQQQKRPERIGENMCATSESGDNAMHLNMTVSCLSVVHLWCLATS